MARESGEPQQEDPAIDHQAEGLPGSGPSEAGRAAQLRTFLIADIRGYTTYTREHGDDAAAALAAQFAELVSEVVAVREGYLLELRGDEALVVFVSARQALRAAVDLQDRVRSQLPRQVGIGLDAGEAISVDGGYRGTALNLAARLSSKARPGEVLASESVIHLAAHIEGLSYLDPRSYRLKGFDEPVRAIAVVPDALAPRGVARSLRRARRRISHDRRVPIALVALVVLIGLTGAALLGDQAVGPTQAPAPVKLTALNGFGAGATKAFDDALAGASRGAIQIEYTAEVDGRKPDSEAMAIDWVKAGKADIGVVATRAFTAYGDTSYDALIAPFLVDSYGLEQRVLESPIVDDMAAGLEPVGLVALGLLPGDLRVVLSKSKPFRTPADFAGALIAHQNGPVGDATFAALGATTAQLPSGDAIDPFDAVEEPIGAIPGHGLDRVGKFVTSNARLWPRPLLVFMSKAAFARLSTKQQMILKSSVRAAIPGQIRITQEGEGEVVGISCRRGVQFGQASESDMAALRTAVEPVYANLERDSLTKRLIDAISQMKSTAVADPPILCSPTATQPPATEPSPIDGVWKACPTEEDILATGASSDDSKGNAGCWTLTFHLGQARADFVASVIASGTCSPCFRGTDRVTDDHVTMVFSDGETFNFGWSVFKETLTLSKVPGAISPEPLLAKPFQRIGS